MRKIYVCLCFSLIAITSIACSNQEFDANTITKQQPRVLAISNPEGNVVSKEEGVPQQIEVIKNKILDFETMFNKATGDITTNRTNIDALKKENATLKTRLDDIENKLIPPPPQPIVDVTELKATKEDIDAYLTEHGYNKSEELSFHEEGLAVLYLPKVSEALKFRDDTSAKEAVVRIFDKHFPSGEYFMWRFSQFGEESGKGRVVFDKYQRTPAWEAKENEIADFVNNKLGSDIVKVQYDPIYSPNYVWVNFSGNIDDRDNRTAQALNDYFGKKECIVMNTWENMAQFYLEQ